MVVFCGPELIELIHLSDYLVVELPRGVQILDHFLSNCALRIRVVKDLGSVHRPDIRPLSVESGRVVDSEEMAQYFCVRLNLRVEHQLHHFCVACVASLYFFISRVLKLPACKPTDCGFDPLEHAETPFHAPEAASRESRDLLTCHL